MHNSIEYSMAQSEWMYCVRSATVSILISKWSVYVFIKSAVWLPHDMTVTPSSLSIRVQKPDDDEQRYMSFILSK